MSPPEDGYDGHIEEFDEQPRSRPGAIAIIGTSSRPVESAPHRRERRNPTATRSDTVASVVRHAGAAEYPALRRPGDESAHVIATHGTR